MNYCVVSPAEITTVSFWEQTSHLDWVVCNTEQVLLADEVSEAMRLWLAHYLEHPIDGMTIGHFHLFVETFSRALGHPLPIVGPKFLAGAAAQNPEHTCVQLVIDEPESDPFVALLRLSIAEQRWALWGMPIDTEHVTEHVTAQDVPTTPGTETTEEPTHATRLRNRPGRVKRHAKDSPTVVRQRQPDDSRSEADDPTKPTTSTGPGGNSL